MTAPVPPISTQFSLSAQAAPDEPAVTCEGRTVTRGELDASTNRLARAYADLGVRQGDYVTIVLPNSIEWFQATLAAWKLGAVPQPLSARMPDAELEGLLELKPRALLVGRNDPRGGTPSVSGDFMPDSTVSDAPLPEAVSPSWKALGSGGSTGRPKLIEAGGDARFPAVFAGLGMGALEGDAQLVAGSAQPQHRHDHRDNRAVDATAPRADAAVRRRRVPAADHRAPRRLPRGRADHHAAVAAGLSQPIPAPTTCRRSVGCGTSVRHARPRSNSPGSICSGLTRFGSCTAAPNFRR